MNKPMWFPTLNREDVYKVLDKERKYQFYRWSIPLTTDFSDVKCYVEPAHSVEEFMLYMEHYLTKAREHISTENGNKNALEQLRKVVTLGIACFEQHGVPDRLLTETVVNGRTGEELKVK